MSKKTALVTGGARGIGAAICRELVNAGYRVYVNCRRVSEETELLISQLNKTGEAETLLFNVTDKESLERAAGDLQGKKIDLLVNNAGILKDNLIYSIEEEDWRNILKTNFFGASAVYEAFKNNLDAADSPVVVNMGSISGVKPRPGQGAYAVSKAMIIEWTKQMALENGDKTAFYCISPGPVATDMIKQAPWYNQPKAFDRIPLKRFAEPEEIGELVAALAETPRFMKNGSNIVLDGGFTCTAKE